ncbi:hypothetical protein BSR28_06720 [Boudabousia liubingyangii]|uniref:hypothetical protein n=1 Tax=Boudabousia liubingyangii TaxID=1921764 RepID=UPI00093C6883|nr:hypothetical protein [Boudabousia liubingyangii]OKL47092.1 hypothetical protein BSR28_06720 [Boudabousia liubingyangii]
MNDAKKLSPVHYLGLAIAFIAVVALTVWGLSWFKSDGNANGTAENGGAKATPSATVSPAPKDTATPEATGTKEAPAAPGSAAGQTPASAASAEGEADCQSPVPGAYPCAGAKKLPAGAIEWPTVQKYLGTEIAVMQSLNGKFGCDGYTEDGHFKGLECIADAWQDNPPMEPEKVFEGGLVMSFAPDGTSTFIRSKTDVSCYHHGACPSSNNVESENLKPGQAWYYGDLVCGATGQGVTCWNYKTGHGAFMSETQIKKF